MVHDNNTTYDNIKQKQGRWPYKVNREKEDMITQNDNRAQRQRIYNNNGQRTLIIIVNTKIIIIHI